MVAGVADAAVVDGREMTGDGADKRSIRALPQDARGENESIAGDERCTTGATGGGGASLDMPKSDNMAGGGGGARAGGSERMERTAQKIRCKKWITDSASEQKRRKVGNCCAAGLTEAPSDRTDFWSSVLAYRCNPTKGSFGFTASQGGKGKVNRSRLQTQKRTNWASTAMAS